MDRSRFATDGRPNRRRWLVAGLGGVVVVAWIGALPAWAQTGTTGTVIGTIKDITGGALPGVEVTVTNVTTGVARTVVTDDRGSFAVALLSPGAYQIGARLEGFKRVVSPAEVGVTETTTLEIKLEVGAQSDTVTVAGSAELVQTNTAALGRVVEARVIASLPLVTRNFTQILGLSPGIASDVTNASELGRGGGGRVIANVRVHGTQPYDNDYKMDGISTNDFENSNSANSAGVTIPSPDAIQEFKVQTGQLDAAYGRAAGANVSVITKTGTNTVHLLGFEYFRDGALNANDYFFNLAGQAKPVLSQHQYGGTVGGPIAKDKLFFFGSYQGTNQRNGSPGGVTKSTCATTVFSPPLTNDRSPAALGKLFAGERGVAGGTAVLPDGSNINPIALTLLNMKLSDGQYLYPTPQVVDPSKPFATQGFSALSAPCTFHEHQEIANVAYRQSDHTTWDVKSFYAFGVQDVPFGANTTSTVNANVFGSPLGQDTRFLVTSLAHNHVINSHLYNELRGGATHNLVQAHDRPAFTWTSLGVAVGDTTGLGFRGPNEVNAFPNLMIDGSYIVANSNSQRLPQWNYDLMDAVTYVVGRHTIRLGVLVEYQTTVVDDLTNSGSLRFRSFPDFLLGMSGAQNGSGSSNVFSSAYQAGPGFRVDFGNWSNNAYVQDDIKFQRLTLNAGLRWELIGQTTNNNRTFTNFDPARADPTPPATGSLAGYVVPSDALEQTPPAGVTKVDNPFALAGGRQSQWAPRAGFAWKVLTDSSRLVLRGGYGLYYTRPNGQSVYQTLNIGPYRISRSIPNATANGGAATFQNPFLQPVPAAFPDWTAITYSPTTARTTSATAMDYHPPLTQQATLNLQMELARDLALEVGYVGSRSNDQLQRINVNAALLASPDNPIRGLTTNTVANVAQRVPILGFQAQGILIGGNTGRTQYDALESSLTKRFSHGFQFLASYTLARALATMGTGTAPTPDGDPRNVQLGPGDFNRRHRLIVSYLWELPGPRGGVLARVFSGWSIAGVTTVQSGAPLTVTSVSSNNAYGITTSDRVQLAPGCTGADLKTPGSVSDNLTNYFNKSCIAPFTVIGRDGIATAYGNSSIGAVTGPGQRNTDLSVTRRIALDQLKKDSLMELRVDAFNVLNTVQFANPDTVFSNPTFGTIRATSVNARVLQLAVRYSF